MSTRRLFASSLLGLALGSCAISHLATPEGDTGDRDFCGEAINQPCESDPGPGERICYYAVDPEAALPSGAPIAEAIYRFETTAFGDAVRVALILSEEFVDNTYGARSSPGYGRDDDRTHTFEDLVASDHARFSLSNAAGEIVLDLKVDYLSEAADAESGFRSRGVWGGEGQVRSGDPSAVLIAATSLDDNLNLRGCVFTESSPSAGECPTWEPRVIYTVWVAKDAFGPSGFGGPELDHIHASPSRMSNSVDVVPGPCP